MCKYFHNQTGRWRNENLEQTVRQRGGREGEPRQTDRRGSNKSHKCNYSGSRWLHSAHRFTGLKSYDELLLLGFVSWRLWDFRMRHNNRMGVYGVESRNDWLKELGGERE